MSDKQPESEATNRELNRVPTPLPCSPRYFAGWQNCEDYVSGGLGPTIEDALQDFLANGAHDEADNGCCSDGDLMTVIIYSTIDEDEAHRRGMDEEFDPDWIFMLDRVIEERTYIVHEELDGNYSFTPANAQSEGRDQ